MEMCTRCKKRVAVVFITRIEGDKTFNEGICMKCAKELGIKQIDGIVVKVETKRDANNLYNEINKSKPSIRENKFISYV